MLVIMGVILSACQWILILFSPVALTFAHEEHHETSTIQFCSADRFCVAQAAYENAATGSHDLYITLHMDGYTSSGYGWTAVGLGDAMEGALMFIVYGNPQAHEKPILSVRTTMKQHHPPLPLPVDYAQAVEVQLVYARWTPVGNQYRAELNLICYNCTLWPGTSIDAMSEAQPWVWAHNPVQPFEAHSEDALLDMHSKARGSGFGFFFMEMKMSVSSGASPPEFPKIYEDQGSRGAASEPADIALSVQGEQWTFRHRAWQVHGFLLTVSFLGLYPLGVILLRQKSKAAFRLHWVVQTLSSTVTALAIISGIYLHPEIEHLHQIIGLACFVAPVLQTFLGWRHHVVFTNTGEQSIFAKIHVSVGRGLISLGAINILLGMVLKQWKLWWKPSG